MCKQPYRRSELKPLLPTLPAAGCPVESNEPQRIRQPLSIEQLDLCDIAVNDGPGTCYILYLNIACNRGEVSLRALDLALPWKDPSFTWLRDPHEIRATYEAYQFPSTALSYPREDVINHRCRGVLRHGHYIEGFLLGFGVTAIPSEYKHGAELDLNLSVITGAGTIPESVKFQIDRSADLRGKVPARRQQHQGLFEKAEPQQHNGLFERAEPDGALRTLVRPCQQQGADYRRGDPVGAHVSRKSGDIGTWPSPSGQASGKEERIPEGSKSRGRGSRAC